MRPTFRVLFIVLVTLASGAGCSLGAAKTDSIVMAYSPFESTALVWIALERGQFRENALAITPRAYDTGVGSLDGLLNGEADIAVGANEFPLVGRAFQKASISSVGCIAKSDFVYLVARRDRGIQKVSDLKGKRVGTTFRTIAEFYLARFLMLNGMTTRDITLANVRTPTEWVSAVVDGDIDAIATAQPYANLAIDGLGANAIAWSAQSSMPLYTQVISKNEWIAQHPDVVERFLRALAQAEEYAIRHPDEAKAIVQKSLNLDAAYMDTVWSQNQFFLSLDQSLILAMEDEARWMIAHNLTADNLVPNFLDYLYLNGLTAVKPDVVKVIR